MVIIKAEKQEPLVQVAKAVLHHMVVEAAAATTEAAAAAMAAQWQLQVVAEAHTYQDIQE